MCTASWWYDSDGSYEVFFNRDEQKSRAPGVPPHPFRRNGVNFLAPLDGARGGTWFASNEFGLTVCLVNHYPDEPLPALAALNASGTESTRGELVLRCAPAKDVYEVLDLLEQQDLGRFRPFHLLALALGGEVKLMTWNGRTLEHSTAGLEAPLTSSSYCTRAVIADRERSYALLAKSSVPGMRPPLEIFHDQHDPSLPAHSVLMNRADACTVSQIHARVSAEQLHLTYRATDWESAKSAWKVTRSHLPVRPLFALAS